VRRDDVRSQDHGPIVARIVAKDFLLMDAAHLLSAVGIVIGTIDYTLLIRRRARKRRQLESAQHIGLQGLVRVLLVDR
jgi:hypothetical protein